ncbi:DUF3422 domain-containing protein [Novosphingobium sp. ZN18A2]|uniref:DUF3422 domain-containing protein n=1 Tax=Novosphingobium sp. ZN18A2 TaxID=3079861 RepID=UPI0030CAB697
MTFREHPLRRQVVGEMHLRRWPPLGVPGTILQWVRTVAEDERAAEAALIERGATLLPGDNPRHKAGTLADGISFVWEGHSEGSSLAIFVSRADTACFHSPEQCADLAPLIAWAEAMPGEVIRATRIHLAADEACAQAVVDATGFDPLEMVSCHVGAGSRLWSDFRVQPDGYGRLVIAANGAEPHDFSRLVKRVQELGNYRNMALIGLPPARAAWPTLNAVEAQLRELGAQVSDPAVTDDRLLADLSDLSLELVSVATSVNYRMSATAAYARLVEERLDELDVKPIAGFQSLSEFNRRRFLPAVRTCAALTDRERQLSLRAQQLSSLLRVRIETRIENQNAQLLGSMERSVGMQLRLQELVEGLSVVALSYYAISLVHYVLKGLETRWHFDEAVVIAVLIPITVLAVWALVHRLKHRLLGGSDGH